MLRAGLDQARSSTIEADDPVEAGVAAGLFSTSRSIGSFAGSIALADQLDRHRRLYVEMLCG
ncbi:MAG: hypothetical protein ABI927_07995, partial [Gaiellaceae bacterium]